MEEYLHLIRIIVLFSVFVEGVRRRGSNDDVAKAEVRLRQRFQIEDSFHSGNENRQTIETQSFVDEITF